MKSQVLAGYLDSRLPTLNNRSGFFDVEGIKEPVKVWSKRISDKSPFAFGKHAGMFFDENENIVMFNNFDYREYGVKGFEWGEVRAINIKNGKEIDKFQLDYEDNEMGLTYAFFNVFCGDRVSLTKDGCAICLLIRQRRDKKANGGYQNEYTSSTSLCKLDYKNKKIIWEYVLPSKGFYRPYIDSDENIYITEHNAERGVGRGSHTSAAYCFSKDGKLKWHFPGPIGSSSYHPLGIKDDKFYVLTAFSMSYWFFQVAKKGF